MPTIELTCTIAAVETFDEYERLVRLAGNEVGEGEDEDDPDNWIPLRVPIEDAAAFALMIGKQCTVKITVEDVFPAAAGAVDDDSDDDADDEDDDDRGA